jgi:glycosyltransferase involved in cell wall biosynthesis
VKALPESSMMRRRPTVALFCSNVYPLFEAAARVPTGGMETRAALFGRGLATSERWQPSFVVSDFGQPFITHHEGIDFHIYQTAYRRAGRNVFPRLRKRRWFPILNLDRHDLDLLWQIPLVTAYLALPAILFPRFWRALKPDIVCCFGNNDLSVEAIADCHRLGIRTMLCIASDEDVSADYLPGNHDLSNYGMPKWKGHYALSTADCIVVQTEGQREAVANRFGRPSVLIRNPVSVSIDDAQRWLPREKREYILWIGRSDTFHKRPHIFLELAKRCPDLPFLMIVNNTHAEVFEMLQAECPDNLRIIERVTHDEIWSHLRRARVFVSTSRFEGFPNTFLQSAVLGTPIVSLEVDPDEMLTKYGCGICLAGDRSALGDNVLRLWDDASAAESFANTCHRYILERHEASGRVAEFEICLEKLNKDLLGNGKPKWWTLYRRFV